MAATGQAPLRGGWRTLLTTVACAGCLSGSALAQADTRAVTRPVGRGSAQPTPQGEEGPACDPAGNQMQMNACAVRDYRAADAQLNLRYSELMGSLANAPRTRLRQQQRDWQYRRDPSCKREARSFEGGSAWPVMFNACLQKTTESRTAVLDKMSLPKPQFNGSARP